MPASDLRLRPNLADVAAKVIDGEAIVMNLTTGAYYSLDGVGALVWELLAQGHPVGMVAEAVGLRFSAESPAILADVSRLAEELQHEGLLLPAGELTDTPPAIPPSSGERQPYRSPELNKYTDMADLLALDPPMPAIGEVHDG